MTPRSMMYFVFMLLTLLFLHEANCRICTYDVTLINFHYTQANGQYQYNGQNQYKKIGSVLYIWQPTGYNAWVIGPDPSVIGVGGGRGHYGWCGKSDVRDCDEGDWWYWNNGWFNDGNAKMLHSKAQITGMTFRREFNGYWDFGGVVSGGDTSSFTEIYSHIDSGKTWYLYPDVGDTWAIGYELPTNPISFEPVARCSQRDLLRCWEGTWSYVRTGAGDQNARISCTNPM